MKNFLFRTVVLVAVVFTPFAQAQEGPALKDSLRWYAGAGVGLNKYTGYCDVDFGSCDDVDTAYKIFGGVVLLRYLFMETGLVDLGDATDAGGSVTSDTFDARSLYGAAGIRLPLTDSFAIHGKIGWHAWAAEYRTVSNRGTRTVKDKKIDTMLGLGAEYIFSNNVGIRAEWEQFDFRGEFNGWNGNLFYAGVTYSF